jgi:hypothetical protein
MSLIAMPSLSLLHPRRRTREYRDQGRCLANEEHLELQ